MFFLCVAQYYFQLLMGNHVSSLQSMKSTNSDRRYCSSLRRTPTLATLVLHSLCFKSIFQILAYYSRSLLSNHWRFGFFLSELLTTYEVHHRQSKVQLLFSCMRLRLLAGLLQKDWSYREHISFDLALISSQLAELVTWTPSYWLMIHLGVRCPGPTNEPTNWWIQRFVHLASIDQELASHLQVCLLQVAVRVTWDTSAPSLLDCASMLWSEFHSVAIGRSYPWYYQWLLSFSDLCQLCSNLLCRIANHDNRFCRYVDDRGDLR